MKKKQKLFEDILKDEFVQRREKNNNYSLRAFARDLGIQPSPLSAILNGKRPITAEMKMRLGPALGLSPKEISKIRTQREAKKNEGYKNFAELDLEVFEVLSQWYYFAILELFELTSFQQDFDWIAKKLTLTRFQVKDALTRLIKLGFIIETKTGHWQLNPQAHFTTSFKKNVSGPLAKNFQKEALKISAQALENIPIEKREHSSVIFAIDEKDLDEAKERIKKFRKEMTHFFNLKNKKTSIYQIQIGLYPLSKLES